MLRRKAEKKALGSPVPGSSSALDDRHDNTIPNKRYQETRDGLILAVKTVKAISESTSLLAPLKATCELCLVFLETTRVRTSFSWRSPFQPTDPLIMKAINDNSENFNSLRSGLKFHVETLDTQLALIHEKQTGSIPIAERDFIIPLRDYIMYVRELL